MIAARLLLAAYLATLMFSLGLGFDPNAGKHESRWERIRVLLRGLAFTLIAVPLLTLGVTRVLRPSADIATVLLLLAAAPGGRYAPQLAQLAGADVPTSAELTVLLVKLTAFTAPVMTRWLQGVHHVEIADLPLILNLLFLQVLPLSLGKALRRKRGPITPRAEARLRSVVNALALVLFAAVIGMSGLRGFAALDGRGLFCIVALTCLAGGIAWLIGGPKAQTRRSFAITANTHNLALSLIIANSLFPEREEHPAILAVWSVFFCINFVLTLVSRRFAVPATRTGTPGLTRSVHA